MTDQFGFGCVIVCFGAIVSILGGLLLGAGFPLVGGILTGFGILLFFYDNLLNLFSKMLGIEDESISTLDAPSQKLKRKSAKTNDPNTDTDTDTDTPDPSP